MVLVQARDPALPLRQARKLDRLRLAGEVGEP